MHAVDATPKAEVKSEVKLVIPKTKDSGIAKPVTTTTLAKKDSHKLIHISKHAYLLRYQEKVD